MTLETKSRNPRPLTEAENRLLYQMGWALLLCTSGALLATHAFAQGNAPGFSPGQKPFSSPFADDLEEDVDEEEDLAPPAPRAGAPDNSASSAASRRSSGASISAGGQSKSEGTEPMRTREGVSMGSPDNSVVSKNNSPFIAIDTMSGEGSKEKVSDFNFPDADIMDIAKTLGKLTGKNFILDKEVKGKITLITNGEITVGDAWRAFLTALDMNNFALVPSGKYIRITRQREARDKQLKTYTGEYTPDSDALITKIFRIKHVSPEEVAKAFHQFVPASARIFPYEQTNTVIVTDSGSNIRKLEEVLAQLDVESFDAGIEVVTVKYASATEISKLIDTLLPSAGSAGPASPPGLPRFGGSSSRFNSRRTKEGGVINTIIADERTNTLIVHANNKGVDQVRELVAKLDQKLPAPTGGGKVHVVYLQFADAESLANTINNLSQNNGRSATGAGAPGGTGVNPVAQSLFEGNIRISPDKSTNSLVVTASPSDFVTVQRVINRLDIQRDEVYVEVVIMEVGVNKTFDFSANLLSPTNRVGSMPGVQDISAFLQGSGTGVGLAGAVLGFAAGNKTTISVNNASVQVSDVMGLVKLLQTNASANVLATPQIMAIDNTEATFESTERIPVLQGSTLAANGIAQQSIGAENLTLSMKIKPQINKLINFVKLDIETKSGDISPRQVPGSLQGQSIATLNRSTKTTVVVGDSDTAVLGGLIRDKVLETEKKVPILGDIPILGWLFKAKVSEIEKTNMLIFLTPHIIRKYDKVRAVLDKKLKERDDYLERTTGGKDPYRYQRDEIIRGLPDIQKLAAENTGRNMDAEEDPDPAATLVSPRPSAAGNSPTPLQPTQTPPTAPMATPMPPENSPAVSGSDMGSPPPEFTPPAPPVEIPPQ